MDFEAIFIKDLDWSLAGEIVFKTLIMFLLILVFLRLTGKKGVRQLSVFEVAIIISLGSAAGDPMANPEHAILPAVLVFLTILIIYRSITWFAGKSESFEQVVEGEPIYIIEEGEFVLTDDSELTYAKDEFFSEMRQQNIEHVGQVQTAILETSGNVSFFYYADEQVRPGLPILPKIYQQREVTLPEPGLYACTTCAHVEYITASGQRCPRCQQEEWVKAIKTARRT
jgi:uncharacterized membrane protein YcaP (DUF421 family)